MDIEQEDPIVRVVFALRDTYRSLCDISSTREWWSFTPVGVPRCPSQGWKLHLSTLPISAAPLLEAVAEALIQRRVGWKVCLTIQQLIKTLTVPAPLSQIGKFITIYPQNEQQAIGLAALLHEKTRQFIGPIVPTDHRYAEDSVVYYRYGGFELRSFYDPDSALKIPCIVTPDGRKVYDERIPGRYRPEWATNPFPSPERRDRPALNGLFGKELRVKGIFNQSAKGGIYVVESGSGTAILKEARFGVNPDLLGRDARDRLTNEFNVLKRLAPLGIAPQPFELFDAELNRYILMEHLAGQPLRAYVEKRNYLGDDDPRLLRRICTSIVDLLRQCHAAGVMLRDLTPNNILITPDGCKLVDLELAHLEGTSEPPFEGFTYGYIPIGAETAARSTPHYDRYSLGAILFFIITGIHPFLAVDEDITPRLESILNRFLRDDSLHDIAELAIAYMREARQADGLGGTTQLSAALKQQATTAAPRRAAAREEAQAMLDEAAVLATTVAVADHLCATANWRSDDWLWPPGKMGEQLHPACFHTGTTGIAYYLYEIGRTTGDPKYYSYAGRIMDWTLSTHPFDPAETPVGLYFGYAAVPWMLALLADTTGETSYRERAIDLAYRIAQAPIARLDMTHGAAGVGLMHLELYHRTGDQDQLTYALELAGRIAEQAEEDAVGTVMWEIGGRRMWGFAHGAAGIAYYLLAVYAQTGDSQLRELVEKTGQSLIRAGIPTAHERGMSWATNTTDRSTVWTHWCNGASGVGQYFLAAAKLLHDPEVERAAVLAANTIRFGHGFGSCSQCHGLAGDGEYLLQVSRELAYPDFEQGARHLASKLHALRFHVAGKPGWMWPLEGGENDAPAYMIGYCGIYSFLLRIYHPDLGRPLLAGKEQWALV
jgi:serine/threonine protein kinase